MPLPPPSAPHENILRRGEHIARGRVHMDSNARFNGEVEWYLYLCPSFFPDFNRYVGTAHDIVNF